MKKIQVIGTEKNKDDAMGSLMNQTTKFICLDEEVYIVEDSVIEHLKKDKIKFKELAEKTGEKDENR